MKAILGTGQLGHAVMECLLKDNPNEDILLINRRGKILQPLPANVQLLAADVTDRHGLEFIARDAEIIYSCTDAPYQEWSTFYPSAGAALSYAISKTKAKLVFADNLYSYGNVHGAPIHEGMPHNAYTKKGKIRAAVLHVLLDREKAWSDRVAFVKAADFIGPRIHKGIFGRDFLDKLQSGKTISLFGNPHLPHTFTFINDFARAIVNVGNADDALGQTWQAPNAPAISPDEWIALFEQRMNKTARVTHVPKVMVGMAGIFNSFVRELYELAYQFEYPYLVMHDKYVNRFGDHSTSPERIVAETIDWFISSRQA